eukprot:g3767.t1
MSTPRGRPRKPQDPRPERRDSAKITTSGSTTGFKSGVSASATTTKGGGGPSSSSKGGKSRLRTASSTSTSKHPPPSQSLAWRLKRLDKMKENYRIVEFMGLHLTGDPVKDSKQVLEKRNQLARLLMPKIYNPHEKHKKKFMRHMALINEAYSLVLKNQDSRDSLQSLMWLRRYYRHFIEYGRRRDQVNLAKLCKMAEKLLLEFRQMQFPIRPIQEVKLAHKILLGIIAFKDVLFLVEQSKRTNSEFNARVQQSITASLNRISPRDTLGLSCTDACGKNIELVEMVEACENLRFGQKLHFLNSTTGALPDLGKSIARAVETVRTKGRWITKWLVCVFAGDVPEQTDVSAIEKILEENKHMALTIVGIFPDGSSPGVFTKMSAKFGAQREGCNVRFCLLNDEDIDFSFQHALELMRGEFIAQSTTSVDTSASAETPRSALVGGRGEGEGDERERVGAAAVADDERTLVDTPMAAMKVQDLNM